MIVLGKEVPASFIDAALAAMKREGGATREGLAFWLIGQGVDREDDRGRPLAAVMATRLIHHWRNAGLIAHRPYSRRVWHFKDDDHERPRRDGRDGPCDLPAEGDRA